MKKTDKEKTLDKIPSASTIASDSKLTFRGVDVDSTASSGWTTLSSTGDHLTVDSDGLKWVSGSSIDDSVATVRLDPSYGSWTYGSATTGTTITVPGSSTVTYESVEKHITENIKSSIVDEIYKLIPTVSKKDIDGCKDIIELIQLMFVRSQQAVAMDIVKGIDNIPVRTTFGSKGDACDMVENRYIDMMADQICKRYHLGVDLTEYWESSDSSDGK